MRLRERSYGINTLKKFKIITDQNIIKESEKKSNYDQLKDTVPTYFTQKEPSSIEKTYNIPLHPPKIENKKRDYSSRGKPIRFHENATISKFNPADVGEINGQKGNVDFLTLMAMFDESEINEITIEKLLGVNIEKFGEMKEKLEKIIQYVNSVEGEKTEALNMLQEKKEQIDQNLENIKKIQSNIENIGKIFYSEDETRVRVQIKF